MTAPASQTLLLGEHAGTVRAGFERLTAQRVLPRLWDKDPSLWSADPAVQSAIRQRLGWLSITGVMAKQAESLRAFAKEIRDAGLTRALLLGMGGSGLFSEVCRNTFGVAPRHVDVTVLDTTDPAAIRAHQQLGSLEQLCIIVSSKSGSTSEVAALSSYFHEALKAVDGGPGAHAIAITDAGTPLETQAASRGFRRVFTHGSGTGAEVGGRFSALTYFGLVPAALMGVDAGRLLQRAEEMFARCGPAVPVTDNPAAQLAAILAMLAQAGRDKMTLLCALPLASFGTWVEQLVAESTGKQGRGIAPIHGEPLREIHAYAEDRVVVELQLASEFDEALDRHVQALASAGHPVVRIHWADRYDLGGEVAKWSLATTLTGGLLDINPFDEPNVKESKDRTKALLDLFVQQGRFQDETPLASDSAVAVYGALGAGRHMSFTECLGEFFRQLRPSDYVAILSFLPRTPTLDQAVHALRESLAKRLRQATMLGIGPRYLHSTGQLYKGGPDGGLFLLLTAEEPDDLPIPGERFSFSVLKQAQALGDFQAMQQKGRRILHIHFRGNAHHTVQRLLSALEEATATVARR
ncbi:MAG: glucose-6-phosphate isomerase [Candidatus Omnitrophica bacterium]|nr:glucose-6-phosphate isomerase [Candidatus Omnitrophota bacterium]